MVEHAQDVHRACDDQVFAGGDHQSIPSERRSISLARREAVELCQKYGTEAEFAETQEDAEQTDVAGLDVEGDVLAAGCECAFSRDGGSQGHHSVVQVGRRLDHLADHLLLISERELA